VTNQRTHAVEEGSDNTDEGDVLMKLRRTVVKEVELNKKGLLGGLCFREMAISFEWVSWLCKCHSLQ